MWQCKQAVCNYIDGNRKLLFVENILYILIRLRNYITYMSQAVAIVLTDIHHHSCFIVSETETHRVFPDVYDLFFQFHINPTLSDVQWPVFLSWSWFPTFRLSDHWALSKKPDYTLLKYLYELGFRDWIRYRTRI